MRDDIREAIAALRAGLVDSKTAVDRLIDAHEIGDDERLTISRTTKRLSILIVALDDIIDALLAEEKSR